MPRRNLIAWPEGAVMALVPAVAFETWPEDLGMPGSLNRGGSHVPSSARFKKDIRVISDRQFGERVGIYRLLELFEREQVKTTFFLNGSNVERLPELAKEIAARGHEVASESYIHDYNFMKTYDEERADLRRTVEAFKRVLGVGPQGFISMGIRPTENTPRLLVEEGYVYWADPQHEEIPYTLSVDGKELAVMAYSQYLNDYTTYLEEARTPRELLQMWKDAFDYLYSEAATSPNMLVWGLHPFISGRPHRAKILQEFIDYVKGFRRVWFARCIDMAKWWLGNYKNSHVERWPNCVRFSEPPYISKAGFADPKYADELHK